jgi:hypothetical protein
MAVKKPLKAKTTAKKKIVTKKDKTKVVSKPTATRKKGKVAAGSKVTGATKKPKKVVKPTAKKKAPTKTAAGKNKAVTKKTLSSKKEHSCCEEENET